MLTIEQFSFAYPQEKRVVENISLHIEEGTFTILCGPSGSGKTTLLRSIKPAIAPVGETEGKIVFRGKNINDYSERELASQIGFVFQRSDTQIVTDKVWHELSFGLENLGVKPDEIRFRVAEMSSFFGMDSWFYKDTSELSGGQQQILSLASVLVMHPQLILLDEPMSQLDPVAATDFIKFLKRINEEFGTTILLSEHNLEHIYLDCDQIIYLEEGKMKFQGSPQQIVDKLRNTPLWHAVPTFIRAQDYLPFDSIAFEYSEFRKRCKELKGMEQPKEEKSPLNFHVKEVYYDYPQKQVLKDISFSLNQGEVLTLIGPNGSGKTTLMKLLASHLKPTYGRIKNKDKLTVSMLPQDPQTLFTKATVEEDLERMYLGDYTEVVELLGIKELLKKHPFDCSGGEQQFIGLAKILMLKTQIVLLDEPTKALDATRKRLLAQIIKNLTNSGTTVVLSTHDIEFAADISDRILFLFNGQELSLGDNKSLLSKNTFYTTSLGRILNKENILTCEDIKRCQN